MKRPKNWCKSISVFANCYSGKLVFRVANDDELVGIAYAKGDSEKSARRLKHIY